jgi:N-acetylglutamate synthase-like GNAT family acetyltransferase
MQITIKNPTTRDELKAYYELRHHVLREPWGQPRGSEKDDYEPISQHFMAIDPANQIPVGVVKLFEKSPGVGWFSHLAVKSEFQRKGIGKQLVAVVEEAARRQGHHILGCMSRLNTTAYFEKLGFKVTGLPANYFGTTQVVWMEKTLE